MHERLWTCTQRLSCMCTKATTRRACLGRLGEQRQEVWRDSGGFDESRDVQHGPFGARSAMQLGSHGRLIAPAGHHFGLSWTPAALKRNRIYITKAFKFFRRGRWCAAARRAPEQAVRWYCVPYRREFVMQLRIGMRACYRSLELIGLVCLMWQQRACRCGMVVERQGDAEPAPSGKIARGEIHTYPASAEAYHYSCMSCMNAGLVCSGMQAVVTPPGGDLGGVIPRIKAFFASM